MFKQAAGLIRPPCQDGDQVVQAAYGEILNLCTAQRSKLIIVVLGEGAGPIAVPKGLMDLGVPIVRSDLALIDRLPEKTDEAFLKAYAHWDGDPPRMDDRHPNPSAHAIIADSIVEFLQSERLP